VTDAGGAARNQRLGMATLSVPSGRYTARVALEAGRAGVVGTRDTIDVISPTSATIALSELALGSRTVPLKWRAASGDTVWIDPGREFRAADPMQLYFEVAGAPHDTTYRIELAIRRPGSQSLLHRIFGGGGGLRLGFVERSRDGRDFIHRELSLEKLKPADYVLEVTASTAGGRKVTRRQSFTVTR
jgi:hypothetical protein